MLPLLKITNFDNYGILCFPQHSFPIKYLFYLIKIKCIIYIFSDYVRARGRTTMCCVRKI